MADMDEAEEGVFDPGYVKAIVTKVCNNCLSGQTFVHGKVPLWTTTIIENVLKELAVANGEAAKNGKQKFKYIVNAQMQQKTGAAMITACAAYWDKATDGTAISKWENEGIQVLVTVHGIAV